MKFWNIILIAVIANGAFGTIEDEWSKFKLEYNKSYPNSKYEEIRFRIFKTNLEEINEHNKNYEKGLVTYKKAINKYGDLAPNEFLARYSFWVLEKVVYNDTVRPNSNTISADDQSDNGADFLDWREKGAVTPVKDQGGCEACWIFSAVGVLEGYYFRTYKKLVSLSEQNILDCFLRFVDSNTCEGWGWSWSATVLKYVQREGINTEEDYPYEAKRMKCRYDSSKNVNITFSNIVQVRFDENKIKTAVANFGPVLIGICATIDWRFYKSGVWYEKECCEMPTHSVLLVGYGRENGHDYWLIKNSMGLNWGENGYIKIARNKHENYCGLSYSAYYIN